MSKWTGRHERALRRCDHDELPPYEQRERLWLDPPGGAVEALEEIVTEPQLLRTFSYYETCQEVMRTCRSGMTAECMAVFQVIRTSYFTDRDGRKRARLS